MEIDLQHVPPSLHLGTSSFSTPDWRGVFYPKGTEAHEFLGHYATIFRTVEIDATWHFMPNPRTVEAWARKVPDDFVFSAKVPKTITHEKQLAGCEEEWEYFLQTMSVLGPKLGPLLFQFPYFAKRKDPQEHATGDGFRRRLEGFLPRLPESMRFVIEIRNPTWLNESLTELLRSRKIALALIDYVTMPRPAQWLERCDPVTADFSYIRFLGDHHAMDNLVARRREEGKKRSDWDELVVDRTEEMGEWVPVIRNLVDRAGDVYAYFNNHYAGFAPGSIELFLKVWKESLSGDPIGR